MNKHYERSVVKHSIEVSFTAAGGTTDYGTINIPQGTQVERFCIDGNGKWSPWFVRYPQDVCPKNLYYDGKPNIMYMHDAKHYGIIVPSANLFTEDELVEIVRKKVLEANTNHLKIVAVKVYREITHFCLADAIAWANENPEVWKG